VQEKSKNKTKNPINTLLELGFQLNKLFKFIFQYSYVYLSSPYLPNFYRGHFSRSCNSIYSCTNYYLPGSYFLVLPLYSLNEEPYLLLLSDHDIQCSAVPSVPCSDVPVSTRRGRLAAESWRVHSVDSFYRTSWRAFCHSSTGLKYMSLFNFILCSHNHLFDVYLVILLRTPVGFGALQRTTCYSDFFRIFSVVFWIVRDNPKTTFKHKHWVICIVRIIFSYIINAKCSTDLSLSILSYLLLLMMYTYAQVQYCK